jgi:hypothetical protein
MLKYQTMNTFAIAVKYLLSQERRIFIRLRIYKYHRALIRKLSYQQFRQVMRISKFIKNQNTKVLSKCYEIEG